LGTLLANNLNQSLPIAALAIPGVAVIMLFLLLLLIHRRIIGAPAHRAGRIGTASASSLALAVSFGSIIVLCALGVMRGGDVQMAKIQVQSFVLLLLMAYLAAASLQGLRDYRTLGRLIVAAACYRALYVLWAVHALAATGGEPLSVAATHGDSLLFASATVLLLARLMERPSGVTLSWCLLFIPLLAAGMVANNRRLVWVEIAAGLLIYVLLSRRSRMKRLLMYAVILMLPLLIGYVAAGWNSRSKIFAPVQTFRSVSDSDVDGSTLYRDLENYNLLATMRFHMLSGSGFGQPFAEPVTLPSISFFKEYRYMPHNSILGLWAFAGPLGFTGISTALVVAVYLAGRSYRRARSADERVAAFMAIATVVIYVTHCWGDIGFSERRSVHLVGPALAIAGQLACATEAWRPRRRGPTGLAIQS
jgi:hypothetical protein